MDINPKKDFYYLTLCALLENSDDMVFVKDVNLVYVAASKSFARLVGRESAAELVGKTDFDFFDQALAQKYNEDDRTILSSGECSKGYIELLPSQNEKKRYSSTSKYLIHDQDGAIVGLYGVARDVTVQMELEAARESSQFSRQMFDAVLEADITKDRLLGVEGSGWAERLNVREEMSLSELTESMASTLIHIDYKTEFLAHYSLTHLKAAYDRGVLEFTHRTYLNGVDDDGRWMECQTRLYHSRISNTVRITTFLRDIDDEVRGQQQLQKKANTDALTGLSNRANVLEQVTDRLAKGAPHEQCALLFIDLDCFKQVNDRWGHRFGDKVLQRTAERLRQIFGADDVLGRIGGDEFLVFLNQVSSKEWVEGRARRLVEAMAFYRPECNSEICVTCSVGVALCRTVEASVDRLYEYADKAMYRAKEIGTDHVYFFDDLEREQSTICG